jgi:hypothetical protein
MLRAYAKAQHNGLLNVALDSIIREAVARSREARKAARAARAKAKASS